MIEDDYNFEELHEDRRLSAQPDSVASGPSQSSKVSAKLKKNLLEKGSSKNSKQSFKKT